MSEKNDSPPELGVKASDSFALSGFIDRHERPVSLLSFVANAFGSESLREAMVESVADVLREEWQGAAPIFTVIASDDPLIAVAAALALDPSTEVPLRRGEKLCDQINAQHLEKEWGLESWCKATEGLSVAGPLLMRAWDIDCERLAIDLKDIGDSFSPRTICTVKSPFAVPQTAALFDLTGVDVARRVLSGAVSRMGVQPADVEDSVFQQFIEDYGSNDLLYALTTRGHSVFFYWLEKFLNRPSARDAFWQDIIENSDTTKAREAASLFVASHFPGLTPDTFIELADLLVQATPTNLPGTNDATPSPKVTDSVLYNCGIHFVAADPRERRRAQFEPLPAKDGGPLVNVAAAACSFFNTTAPLMKERYLQSLALNQTLGHVSTEVVKYFRDLEAEAIDLHALEAFGATAGVAARQSQLSDVTASALEAARVRILRAVYGYPAVLRAGEAYLRENRRTVEAKLYRSVDNCVGFLEVLSRRSPGLDLNEIARTLCMAEPVDTETAWDDLFDLASCRLFWLLFLQSSFQVTISAYAAFFGRNGLLPHAALHRRSNAMSLLSITVRLGECNRALSDLHSRVREPSVLARLLGEASKSLDDLYASDSEPFARFFLVEICLNHLFQGLRGRPWRLLPIPSDPAAVLGAIFGTRDLIRWLDPRDRPPLSDESLPEEAWRSDEAHRCWYIVLTVLDGLTGCASLGDFRLETRVSSAFLNIFLRGEQELPPAAVSGEYIRIAGESEIFNHRDWWEWLRDPTPPEEGTWRQPHYGENFRILFEMSCTIMALLLAMSATRSEGPEGRAAFSFAPDVIRVLGERQQPETKLVVEHLLEIVDVAIKLREKWLDIAGRADIPAQERKSLKDASEDRRLALINFRQALREARGRLKTPAASSPSQSFPACRPLNIR